MGQNQARVGEQQGTLEEKEPSPDPGGSEEEGNASVVTCGEVEDEAGLVRERLDVSPGTEPASPTLKLDTRSHKKGAPPIDWEWIQGGDGEREGGRESGEGEGGRTEVRGLQKLNNIRVTKGGMLSTEVAGSSKPERVAAVAERSSRMDLENSANDSQELKVIHNANIQDSSSGVESVHFQQSKSSDTEEKSVTSELTGGLEMQGGSSMTDIVAVPGINAFTVTEGFHDGHFPFETPILKTEAPTRTTEKNDQESLNALLQKRLPGENPLWQDGPAAVLTSCEPNLAEGDIGRSPLSTSSTDNLPLKWSSAMSECQEMIISSEVGGSGVRECAATSEQIYGIEVPSLPVTTGLSDRSDKTTEDICPPNSGDFCDFATTVERKIRDKFGKIKKHQAAGSNIESAYTSEKNTTNPESSVMSSSGPAIHTDPTTSGFEETLEEEKDSSVPDSERAKNYAKRKTAISCDAEGVSHDTEETEEFPLKQEDRVDCYPPEEIAKVQTEKIPEQFLAVVTGHSEMLSLPESQGIMGEMDPRLALYAAMESKGKKEVRSQAIFSGEATASDSKLSGNIRFSNQDRDKENTMAREKSLEEGSTAVLEKDRDKSSDDLTSTKRDRGNQSVHKNIPDIHQEASVSICNSELISVSESTAGHEEGGSLLSNVGSGSCIPLAGLSKAVESHVELQNMANETKLCIEGPMKAFTDAAEDGCGSSGTDNATTPSAQVQNSPQMCCTQHNPGQSNLAPQSAGQSLASDRDTATVSQTDRSTGIRNDPIPVSAQGGVPARDRAETPPKGKPVSDLIKETIQLHEKMKEWTKPAEAKADVVLDSAQSVKVAEMKAAFDSPKRSTDKGLERKPSVRKGKTLLFGAQAS